MRRASSLARAACAALPLLAPSSSAQGVPPELQLASPRGQARIPIRQERGVPALAAAQLALVLSVATERGDSGRVTLLVAGRAFELVAGVPYFQFERRLYQLAHAPYVARDSLFVPFQLAVEFLPRLLAERFRYDAARSRLTELGPTAVATSGPPATPTPRTVVRAGRDSPEARATARSPSRPGPPRRIVAVDAGHGGPDYGMRGPLRGGIFLAEKQVTLAIARELERELGRRGVEVVMTRSRDELVPLRERGRIAITRRASLFVSIHVNAANPRWRDAEAARGFETYFLAEARTEDAQRVAAMENESVRYETDARASAEDPLAFLLNDLAQNEHLRESSRLAAEIQGQLARVHPGENRGVKQAGFMVLSTSYMPAVLVETGFGSNREDARFLTGASDQRRLARALADAIERYLAEYQRRLTAGPA